MEISGTIVPTRGEPSTLKKLNSSDLVNNGLLILHLAILQMIFESIQIEDVRLYLKLKLTFFQFMILNNHIQIRTEYYTASFPEEQLRTCFNEGLSSPVFFSRNNLLELRGHLGKYV
jgi:hypothetical protein